MPDPRPPRPNAAAAAAAADVAADPTVLHIDWTLCDGRGLCTELLPELLGRDEWGYPLALNRPVSERSNVPVQRSLLPAARDAIALCPRQALRLTESAKLTRLPSNGRG
ncbi:ferredoxin [Subtercola vilae]|uniref:ferredoxin n=1 Tax=Subtercola vilae TaxID=2056433 RepID=UPI001F3188AF|nr:ferredoxin [Subtercola vilae]